MNEAGDGNRLAVTLEWNIPSVASGVLHPVTRFPVAEAGSLPAHIRAVEEAKIQVNDIFTHVVEKGNWPQLPIEVQPKCDHGFPLTDRECMLEPSHWTKSGQDPDQRIAEYVRKMSFNAPSDLLAITGGQLDVAYSDGANTKLDIYGVDTLPGSAPVFAFIHGGYWQEGSRKQATVMVRNMFNHGVITALIGYDLAPVISLEKMVEEIVDAVGYLDRWCSQRGHANLYVCGHSAGAHLLAMAVMNESMNLQCVKGIFLVSGVYDLVPYIGTCTDRPIGLTDESAKRLSPSHCIQTLSSSRLKLLSTIDIHIVLGENEPPSFYEQSRRFLGILKTHNISADQEVRVMKNIDHFSIIECLDDPQSEMFQCIRDCMGLSAK